MYVRLKKKSDKELFEIVNTTKDKILRDKAFNILFERDKNLKQG